MSSYKLQIDADALEDIQKATDWYNEQLQGLESRFQKQITKIQAFGRCNFQRIKV